MVDPNTMQLRRTHILGHETNESGMKSFGIKILDTNRKRMAAYFGGEEDYAQNEKE